MRAPRRFIATESFGLSIGVGALIPLVILLIGSGLPEDLSFLLVLLAPLVGGFSASIVFGTTSPGGFGYTILISIIAYLITCFAPIALFALGVRPSGALAAATYFSLLGLFLFPPFFLIPLIASIAGAKIGWVAAEAIDR